MPLLILAFFFNLSTFLVTGSSWAAFFGLISGAVLVLSLNNERLANERDRP